MTSFRGARASACEPGIQRLFTISGFRVRCFAPPRNDGAGGASSALRHGDVDAADIALRADRDGLLVAARGQRQVCRKAGGFDEDLDLAAPCGALQVAEDIAAPFAPVAGDAVAIAGDIAAQVELVAVAGAMQVLLQ